MHYESIYEDAQNEVLSKVEAIAWIKEHCITELELFEGLGDKDAYTGKELLDFMGY